MGILLKLFLTFLEIGTVSFGGGYAMIALVREKVLQNGWLTSDAFNSMIAVSESTPGPVAVNMATFVGSQQAGFAGALLATLGVVLPSFIIILLIASVMQNVLKIAGVRAVLDGVKPVAIGLIVSTGIIMILSVVFGIGAVKDGCKGVDCKGIFVFLSIASVYGVYYKMKKKFISPIVLILISAVLGIALYSW